jgi:FkbM family methyltransferase
MAVEQAKSVVKKLLGRFGLRVLRSTNMPQADVAAFCAGISARGFSPRHIFDVGANRGDWSRAAQAVFPDAIFTLIEPQGEMEPFLNRFQEDSPGARWIRAGAGATKGELKLAAAPDTVSSSFAVSEKEASQFGWTQRTVPVVTLDDVCRDIGAFPEIVKIDVEGFERDVLQGAQTLLGNTEVFLLELTLFRPRTNAMTFAETIAFMDERGYVVYDFTGFQPRPYDGALGLCEVAFAKSDGLLRSSLDWDKYE